MIRIFFRNTLLSFLVIYSDNWWKCWSV